MQILRPAHPRAVEFEAFFSYYPPFPSSQTISYMRLILAYRDKMSKVQQIEDSMKASLTEEEKKIHGITPTPKVQKKSKDDEIERVRASPAPTLYGYCTPPRLGGSGAIVLAIEI